MAETIIKACPLCGGDVKGNKEYKYYCRSCRILFTRKELAASREQLQKHVKKTIVKKIDKKLLRKVYNNSKNS